MPFDASKPYSDAPTGGFNPSKPYTDSAPPPQEKPAFSGSFGNVTRNVPFRDPIKDAGAAVYGLGTSLVGGLGDVGVTRLPGMIPGMPFSAPVPTTKEVRGEMERKGLAPGPGEEGFVAAGEYAPLAAAGAGLAEAGIKAAPKLADILGTKLSALTGRESAGRIAKLSEGLTSGQTGKNILSRATKAATRRSDVADRLYEVADDRMAARFQKGDVWQESQAGRAFFMDLKRQLATDKATTVTSDTRKVLTEIGRELAGTPREDGTIAYSTPKVLRTTLRELRDAAAGDPKEGFKAIGQQEAGTLANKLAASLGQWEPSLQSADFQYQSLTKKLYPEGVTPGKFSKEKKAADKAINLLENRLKQGTIKAEDVTKQVRQALKSPAVTRLVSEADARQINAELDAIDKIKAKEDKTRAAAKFAAKWLGAGALGAAGLDLLKGRL